jgi:hypothetical protein
VVNAVAGEIRPVATNSTASAFFASLTSSGVNDIAVGFDLESSGDRYVVGYGNVVNPVPIGSAYYRAWMSSASSANARAFQINNNAGNEIAYWNGNGALYTSSTASIGTTTPYARSTVWGGSSDTTLFEVVNSASTTALSVSASGFGTTTLRGLAVNGSATSTSNVGFNITAGCFAINNVCLGSGGVTSVTNADGSLTISPTTGAVVASLNLGNANSWTGLQQFNRASTTQISAYDAFYVGRTATTTIRGDGVASVLPYASSTSITTSGNTYLATTGGTSVGIGTTSPYRTLSVVGNSVFAGANTQIEIVGASTANGDWVLQNVDADARFRIFDAKNGAERVTISGAGFTGIGSSTPWAQLSVNPTAANGASPAFAIGSSSATNFVVTNAGNVGIGTTSPFAQLALTQSNSATIPLFIQEVSNTPTAAAFQINDVSGTDFSLQYQSGFSSANRNHGTGIFNFCKSRETTEPPVYTQNH